MVAALARLQQTRSDWTAWIVGGVQRPAEQSYQDRLRALAESFGIEEKIRFLGQRKDVPDLLTTADVFCQPNVGGEPFGIVFIEALRAGLPVVTSNIGGGAEIVTGECGQLAAPEDAEDLAVRLATYCEPSARPEPTVCKARALHLCDPLKQMSAYHDALSRSIHRITAR